MSKCSQFYLRCQFVLTISVSVTVISVHSVTLQMLKQPQKIKPIIAFMILSIPICIE